ncbi:GTP pyrophosphokinase family protein [Vibrio vulnificus]|uniref:GTP pyrophosphokinase n=1 Tax=Vibrio vulnificus TaxID=672 RepID=UPI0019D46D14|nr:RelA/SpoT domain-containing protein [Vibrio vulnificus]ELS3556853.1 RelA/SpoT domain-containing protein [Vibrio vulnificus]MBN8145040.1 RelA/SpoT domain-containing protein [Vibrio vulnificus]HAS6161754.1 (p)ppGpp synthetase [Vibrio vulnificus]HAU8284388.1 (p)ppGpp synthetase [Vibrio vulnificus]HDY7634259.1 RelA/SpoT domain-containing protein [Vibrio vulnificus]
MEVTDATKNSSEAEHERIVAKYLSQKHVFERFMKGVVDIFTLEPDLNTSHNPTIYTVKSRLKDPEHLRDKLKRKEDGQDPITVDNVFERITDFAGVRVLHMYQDQFKQIHELIMSQDWHIKETPVAYSWDPESTEHFRDLGLEPKIKPSYYTSIHYLVQPKEGADICCEIQVRTLFEEIWGEIDHTINYPHPVDSIACKEQLRVLSKLVSTGTRLADSIFRTYNHGKT